MSCEERIAQERAFLADLQKIVDTLGELNRALPDDRSQACGAYVTTQWFDGNRKAESWCSRTSGPCPYPGGDVDLVRHNRMCMAEFERLNPHRVDA